MEDTAKRKKRFKQLTVLLGVAGLVWFVGGFLSSPIHYILYPLIGILHWAGAWYCHQMSLNL